MVAKAIVVAVVATSGFLLPLSDARAGEGSPRGVPECADREVIVGHVRDVLEQRRVARGETFEGDRLEVFAAPDGAWTALLTMRDGRTCFAGYGDRWQLRRPMQARADWPS